MKKLLWVITVLSSMGLVAGCQGTSPSGAAGQVATAGAQGVDQMQLSGNWDTACSTAAGFGNFKSQKEEYHLGDDGTFQKKSCFFNDNNCQNPSFVRQEDGTYAVQGTSSVNDGVPVNFSFTKVSIVPDNQNAVSDLNALNYCGVKTYAVGQASDVTAQSSNTLCVGITHSPRTTYDMMKLVDNNHLAFGDDAQQEDSTKRPQNVNQNQVFTKQ